MKKMVQLALVESSGAGELDLDDGDADESKRRLAYLVLYYPQPNSVAQARWSPSATSDRMSK